MTLRRFRIPLAAALAALCVAAAGAELAERPSTQAGQKSLNITVYNGGIALVHDRRAVSLEGGENRVAWRDVSAQIDATSALLESVTKPGSVRVIEQNFDYNLLTPAALLQKYVGHDVTIVHDRAIPGEPLRETARVLSTNDGIVLKYADRVETSVDGRIVFPGFPANLRDRPTLVLDFDSGAGGDQELDLSYLTGGIGWHAEYVGVLSPSDDRMDLNGLVTLENTSGTSYPNARLQLVAGNVNIVQAGTVANAAPMDRVMAVQKVTQENYFEYHLYTLSRPTSIGDNQTKQVSLLSAHGVPVVKSLELRGTGSYYRSQQPDLGDKLPVGAYLTFVNKDGDLGIPLPGGIVRIYKNDKGGTSQFLGSDRIDHTPKNETVRLHVGDSFDVTATKKQTNYRVVTPQTSESSYEIVLKNAKTEAQSVLVVEPIPGDWSIVSENLPHRKTSSSTATWSVNVPAGGSATLQYTARVTW